MRIIVTGLVAQYPLGGVVWDYMQYVLGLRRLGHDVYYYEDTWSWPYHPLKNGNSQEGEYSAQYIAAYFLQYAPELKDHWHYVHLHDKGYGMERKAFSEVARSADVFLNISGSCIFPDDLSSTCIKVFIDTDPGYNQIILSERPSWSENVDRWCARVKAHDKHFTYAENIHDENCMVPKVNLNWVTTRMPIVLAAWQPSLKSNRHDRAPWTTVMSWNAFKGKLIYDGTEYKSKGAEFDRVIELPQITDIPFKAAIGGITPVRKRQNIFSQLSHYGWSIVDGPEATLTPERYQDFIADSHGEISIAKHVYVAMQTGWFSCRSACYLAAGKPVVVQETGFSNVLPVGAGLFSFSTLNEAVDAVRQVEADYSRHASAARKVAEEYFDSDKVLTDLLHQIVESD